MPFFTSRNSNSYSDAGRSDAGSQDLIQPQNIYKRFKTSMSRLFGSGSNHQYHDTTLFQGARGINISGNPTLMNVGMYKGNMTTVHNYGGNHGLEKLENFVSFAALHDSSEQDPDRRCHPGTREKVLSQLRHWIDNPNPTDRIIWLYGPAGAGKSAIAQTIAHGYKQGEVAATFFFYRSDSERNNGNRLFPTIGWQLAFSIPDIKEFIVHVLDNTPHLPRKDVETQFEQLVIHPFRAMNNVASQMPQPAPVVIIDGVDECSSEQLQRRFLSVIGNAVKDRHFPLRFLIPSRPEPWIEETLDQFKDSTLRIDLAALDDSHHDIEKYLVDQFSDIASKRGLNPAWPGEEIIQELTFKSSGNFIFADTVMRFIGDEDQDPETQLDIIRNLKPHGMVSPFALLDELYLEILKRQLDQEFLKTFLALFIGRTFIGQDNLHKDYAMLMNVSEKGLHMKLRRMRSLLKFTPYIDTYHRSFLDFLLDSSRSGQYHVSKRGGLKQYWELLVDSVVQHVSFAIRQPDCHEGCHSSPEFQFFVRSSSLKIQLSIECWQKTLKPLLNLQDKLLNTPKPPSCLVTQVARDLLLHLAILQGHSHPITTTQVIESNMNERTPAVVNGGRQNTPEKDLDNCLSGLLSCLQKTDLVIYDKRPKHSATTKEIIDRISSLLAFDHAEILARIHSVSDAQKLIDFIDSSILNECGPDTLRRAAHLASEIFARVPVLSRSLFLNGPTYHHEWSPESTATALESICQRAFISRILDRNYVIPVERLCNQGGMLRIARENMNAHNESVKEWIERSNPNLVTRIRIMLEIAKTIRYIHSMDVVLFSAVIRSRNFILDPNFRAKVLFIGSFAWWVREASIYDYDPPDLLAEFTYESNISAFADLFYGACFIGYNENLTISLAVNAKQLIKHCGVKDPKSRPTMEEVVKEMETWDLT